MAKPATHHINIRDEIHSIYCITEADAAAINRMIDADHRAGLKTKLSFRHIEIISNAFLAKLTDNLAPSFLSGPDDAEPKIDVTHMKSEHLASLITHAKRRAGQTHTHAPRSR